MNIELAQNNIESKVDDIINSLNFLSSYAEIGISTQKLHARGPMGLREMTTYKWVIEGNGQIRR